MNGEPVIVLGSSGTKWNRHSAGNILGLSRVEYLALPARARVSVSYTGESGEGFLGLKKL